MNKKLLVWQPLLFSLVMILGMVIGYKLQNTAGSGKNIFAKNKEGALQEALHLIRLKYVDTLALAKIESAAIQDLINELDPHSVYIPPADIKKVNEELAGSFDGIGIEYQIFDDTINVLYVMPDGPSHLAGLEAGDKILSVGDSSLVGKGANIGLLRGDSGSKITIKIKRATAIKEVAVTRGPVPVASIEASFMMNDTTGFIKLNKFTNRSYEEFMPALEGLLAKGMKALVLDLRGNNGGYMQEAIDIADEFLDEDKLIVYTEGANSKKKEYRCKRPGLFEKGKLSILIDELSASASEVLAGALQDWCRAEIIGRRSFGKGLVQEQFPLSDGGALRLTIARYYTPVGRSIQRPYDQGKKVYMDDLWQRFSSGEMTILDSSKAANGKELKTVCGTTVYGGGGIMPTKFVPLDTTLNTRKAHAVALSAVARKYIHSYYLAHKAAMNSFKTPTEFVNNFIAKGNAESYWSNFPDKENVAKLSAREKEKFHQYLLAYLVRYKWYISGFNEIMVKTDDTVKATF